MFKDLFQLLRVTFIEKSMSHFFPLPALCDKTFRSKTKSIRHYFSVLHYNDTVSSTEKLCDIILAPSALLLSRRKYLGWRYDCHASIKQFDGIVSNKICSTFKSQVNVAWIRSEYKT